MDGEPDLVGAHTAVANQTALHPVALAALLVMIIATLVVPRRHAVIPMIVLACFIPSGQRLVLFGCDFSFLRLLTLCGWLRIMACGETRGFQWKTIDSLFVLWALAGTIAYCALEQTFASLIFKCGETYDSLGLYFLIRCLVRDWDDLECVLSAFIIISIPVALAFCLEYVTHRNPFLAFGGVPRIMDEREGRVRCQGAFSHAILAGCFWAWLVPMLIALRRSPRYGLTWVAVGLVTISVLVTLSASSTPILASLIGVFGMLAYPLRRQMRAIRWGVLLLLVTLHMVMKAPVWNLIARIDLVSGNTGWHRYYLIDRAIYHFGEWWALGTHSTAPWGFGLQDVTNQYILEGVRGGALTMLLFILIIALAFGSVGRLWRACGRDEYRARMAWAMGVALFVHCQNFIAVSYFGQMILPWYLLLATIASLSASSSAIRAARANGSIPVRSTGHYARAGCGRSPSEVIARPAR